MSILTTILDRIPESLVRQCGLSEFYYLQVVLVILTDVNQSIEPEKIEKLQFIFNRPVRFLHATADSIRAAIDRGSKAG